MIRIHGTRGDRGNHLLAGLPDDDYRRLRDHLQVCELQPGDVLHESRAAITHVHFPHDAVVVLTQPLRDGRAVAVAMVGREGVIGVGALLGDATLMRAQVQSAGTSSRIEIAPLRDALSPAGPLDGMLRRFTQALFGQISQAAVCHRHHSLEQQLCRWLLMTADRLSDNFLHMTHEGIAGLLGVRREGVTEAAGRLQQLGIIEYARGKIMILNRRGLEAHACECYRVIRQETDRLLPAPALSA